ncbi:ubiquitin 3 binding protein But2 C-terminal domain-containing protein [Colletotrichum cereale]|nr:ubiquitin 3 binding protein But2 C-terminal domain-containing protein [Colletotrichum cereale]
MKVSTVTGAALAYAISAAAAPGTPYGGKGACPTSSVQPDGSLGKSFVSTSLLVPIAKCKPNFAFPATKWAQVTPNDICTVFNLDLPVAQTQGKVCNLVFDFPSQEAAPGKFFFHGPGTFNFTGYAIGAGAVAGQTTYKNQPAAGPNPPNPPPTMTPGHSYVINSAPCGIPATVPGSVTVSGSLCSPDTTFSFYQSNDGCPVGFFVVLTDIV